MKMNTYSLFAAVVMTSGSALAGLKEEKVKEEVQGRITYQQERWQKALGVKLPVEVAWKALGDFCSTSNPDQQADFCRSEGVIGKGIDAMVDIALGITGGGSKKLESAAAKSKFKKLVVGVSKSSKVEVSVKGGAIHFNVPVGPKSDTSVDAQTSNAWSKTLRDAL